MKGRKLSELAEHVGGKLADPGRDPVITSAGTLDSAGPGEITFFSNVKYRPTLATTKAEAVLVSEREQTPAAQIICEDPYYAFMQIVVLLHGHREHKRSGISPHADIDKTAKIGDNCHIHNFATVSQGAVIGDGCIIYPGAFIGPDVVMGSDCIVYPNAVIYDNTKIGSRVIIQACAAVGQDGFGFATHKGEHHKIPQIGSVVLEDDVEIGSCCVIERGTLDDTVIGKGSKIGDAVAIGHGTKVGPHCLLVPQAGIAGSANIGHHCVFAGQAGVVGHIKIGNMVKVGAKAGVVRDVPDGAEIVGAPAIDANKAKRAYSLIEFLPEIRKRLKTLENRVAKMDK